MIGKKGFTLVELMIVIGIIAIIAAIAIPNLLQSRIRANEASAVTQIRNYGNAQLLFITGRQGRLSTNSNATASGYATNYRNLYYGNPVHGDTAGALMADTASALRLIAKTHADAFIGAISPTTLTTPEAAPATPAPFTGYYFGNPSDVSARFYETHYAQIAVPGDSSRSGNKALFYDDNGAVLAKTLPARQPHTATSGMNTPLTDTTGWVIN